MSITVEAAERILNQAHEDMQALDLDAANIDAAHAAYELAEATLLDTATDEATTLSNYAALLRLIDAPTADRVAQQIRD